MTFTLFSADSINTPSNCVYPNKTEVTDSTSLAKAVSKDYVCAEYKNSYRNNDNFLGADCLPVDCDNDHSENPADWVTPDDIKKAFQTSALRCISVATICVRKTERLQGLSFMCCFRSNA